MSTVAKIQASDFPNALIFETASLSVEVTLTISLGRMPRWASSIGKQVSASSLRSRKTIILRGLLPLDRQNRMASRVSLARASFGSEVHGRQASERIVLAMSDVRSGSDMENA